MCFLPKSGVSPHKDEDETSRFSYRPAIEGRYVSIVDVLSPNWRYKLRKYASRKFKKIEDCRRRLLRYELPPVSIRTKSLDDVRTTFIRINSGGMRVTAADQAFAKASRFNLRELARNARLNLPDFEKVPFDPIILGFMFANGRLEVGQEAVEAMIDRWDKDMRRGKRNIKDFNNTWGRYVDSLGRAVDFPRESFCVLNDQFLPSENILATLPVFFQHNGAQPGVTQRRELRKWFWATALGQRYSGRGCRKNVLADLRFFQRLAENGRARFSLDEPADKSDLLRAQYTQKSALTKALAKMIISCPSAINTV